MANTMQPAAPAQAAGPGADAVLRTATVGYRLAVTASGAWTAANAAVLSRAADEALEADGALRSLEIDASAISECDTYGAWLMERLMRRARERGLEAHLVGLPPRFQALFGKVEQSNRKPDDGRKPKPLILRQLDWLADMASRAASDAASVLSLFGACGETLLRAVVRPGTFRLTSTVHHLDRVVWQAVPIVVLITFLIGCIIAQQGFFHFRKFGAEDYVVDLVGVLVLREIGVLLVAIMVAGRSGSSYTAELGSMKMREEIDALRTMGRDPVEVLILPRLIALVIGMPVLTFIGGMAALYGGGLVAWLYAGMSPDIYISRLEEAVSLTHFKVGMIKAPFMALVIGLIASSEGLKVKGSAESLGLQTTNSVVKSIFMVIVLDGLFAIFFSSIGM